jgi:hypothetical protein
LAPHSITSSARAISVWGTVRPNVFAVCRPRMKMAPTAGAIGAEVIALRQALARFQSESYFTARVVNQICGAPLTPALSITSFNRADDALLRLVRTLEIVAPITTR